MQLDVQVVFNFLRKHSEIFSSTATHIVSCTSLLPLFVMTFLLACAVQKPVSYAQAHPVEDQVNQSPLANSQAYQTRY